MQNVFSTTSRFGDLKHSFWTKLKRLSPRHRRAGMDYKTALLIVGRKILEAESSSAVSREGCVALMRACIDAGVTNRRDIINVVGRREQGAGRLAGVQLTKLTGQDSGTHLWSMGADGQYKNL